MHYIIPPTDTDAYLLLYPHAYECGCDHMKLIENNLEGNSNKPVIGTYKSDIYMMKYNEICIKNFEV